LSQRTMKLVVALCLLFAASALSAGEEEMFTNFVNRYGKTYSGASEFFTRFSIFKDNVAFIRQENTKNLNYTLAVNEFADLTNLEFMDRYSGLLSRPSRARASSSSSRRGPLPSSVDWRAKGVVTPVVSQGMCGACWAFSAIGTVESAYAIKSGKLVPLSMQQLIDCSGPSGNEGCNGGLQDNAFRWIKENGICSAADYPFSGRDEDCVAGCVPVTKLSTINDIPTSSEQDLLEAVAGQPVGVAIEADQSAFQFYSSGIFTAACGRELDHGVLVVGYSSQGAQPYWIVKNSWGSSWGEQGYIRMVRNRNICGIADLASHVTI